MPKWHPFSVASVFASVQQLNWLLGAHHRFIWKWQLGSLNTPGEITDPQVKWPLKPTGHPTSVRLNCYRVLWSNDCRDSTSQIQSALSQLVCQQWCHIMSYRIPRWQTPRGASKNIIYIYSASVHDPSPLYHSGSTSICWFIFTRQAVGRCGLPCQFLLVL